MIKIIRGLTLGVVLTLSLVATGADAFAADMRGDNAVFVSGRPLPPPTPADPILGTFGITWED